MADKAQGALGRGRGVCVCAGGRAGGGTGQLSDVVVIHHTEVVAKVHRTDPGDPVRYDVDFSHKPFL